MNNEAQQERFGYYVKFVAGILFLAFVSGLISLALLDTLGYEDISIYILWGIWAVILSLYCWNAEPEEYPQHKETPWEARSRYVGDLCSFTFMGFLYTIGSVAVLGMLLKGVLSIDILETGNAYRLLFLAWGGWIIGLHLYYKHQDEKRLQEQLELLRQGESVNSPHPKLNKRWEDEKRFVEFMKKRKQQEAAIDPFYGSSAVLSQEEKEKTLNKFAPNRERSGEKKEGEEIQVIFHRKNPTKNNDNKNL